MLQHQFDDRIIVNNFAVSRPPRTSDQTPMDFWLWSYIETKVCTTNPWNLSRLKDALKREVLPKPPAMIRSLMLSAIFRIKCVTVCEGRHV